MDQKINERIAILEANKNNIYEQLKELKNDRLDSYRCDSFIFYLEVSSDTSIFPINQLDIFLPLSL